MQLERQMYTFSAVVLSCLLIVAHGKCIEKRRFIASKFIGPYGKVTDLPLESAIYF